MKTIEQIIVLDLQSKGLFETQAKKVIEKAKTELTDTTIPWDSIADGYPSVLINVIKLSVKSIALKWIEENASQAWFKPMFE